MSHKENLGAGVLIHVKGDKYLLEENTPEPGTPDDVVGKLRPAGGGYSKRDNDLHDTIVREIGEEFGLDKEFVEPKLTLLGYQASGPYKDCAIFSLKDSGLSAKTYSATNSKYEEVKLVESTLSDPNYIGPQIDDLREPKKGEYGYKEPVHKKASYIGEGLVKMAARLDAIKGLIRANKTGRNVHSLAHEAHRTDRFKHILYSGKKDAYRKAQDAARNWVRERLLYQGTPPAIHTTPEGGLLPNAVRLPQYANKPASWILSTTEKVDPQKEFLKRLARMLPQHTGSSDYRHMMRRT